MYVSETLPRPGTGPSPARARHSVASGGCSGGHWSDVDVTRNDPRRFRVPAARRDAAGAAAVMVAARAKPRTTPTASRFPCTDTKQVYASTAEQLRPATYYVHVRGYESSCPAPNTGSCGPAWSNVVELAIPGDAPTLVFHGAVGDIELGMSRSAVERRYGGGDVETLRGYSLAGTRYARRVLTRVRYQLHGGVVAVD